MPGYSDRIQTSVHTNFSFLTLPICLCATFSLYHTNEPIWTYVACPIMKRSHKNDSAKSEEAISVLDMV